MCFVSKRKYNVLKECYEVLKNEKVARDITIDRLEEELNDQKLINNAAMGEVERVHHQLDTYKNRSASAVNREKWKRAKKIKDYEFRIAQLEKTNSELMSLNDKYLRDLKQIKTQYELAAQVAQELTKACDGKIKHDNKPTVEELKWETHQCEREKLKGTRKSQNKAKIEVEIK